MSHFNEGVLDSAILEAFPDRGAHINEILREEFPQIDDRATYVYRLLAHSSGKGVPLLESEHFDHTPVSVKTFLFDPFYMGVPTDELWPEVLKAIVEINSGKYIEAVLTGAIGVAKTTIALYTQLYQLYLLSCYLSPHKALGIAPTDEILFVFQNRSATLSKVVDFERFKAMVDRSNYFREVFPYDTSLKSELRFAHRIKVLPVSGLMTAAIGQNVFSALIDEVNFMAVTKGSKMARDGGLYDQAAELYNAINMRRKSRFLAQGKLPGVVCLVSSRQYPGQFTDRKEEERKTDIDEYGFSGIYLYDKTLWDVKPWQYSGKRFPLYLGDATTNPRLLTKAEYEELPPPEKEKIVLVPIELRREFELDIMGAIRDIAGRSTMARHPYIMNTTAITKCFSRVDTPSVFSRIDVDFEARKLQILTQNLVNVGPKYPRWVHLDLALTGDSCGLVVGHVESFVNMDRGGTAHECLPMIRIDGALEILPPPGKEINFAKVRKIIYTLSQAGLPIRWVSADQYQSADMLQLLANEGYHVQRLSVDTSVNPYAFTKAALYDYRIVSAPCPILQKELGSVEYDAKKRKVDHPEMGSKDVSDALAGVVYGLTMSREVWTLHNVNPGEGLLAQIEEEKQQRAKQAARKQFDSYFEGDSPLG